MRAVDAGMGPGVDVELAVDHDAVALVRRHRRGQRRVVVDLQLVSRRVGDDQVLVAADLGRLRQQAGVERNLGAGAALENVLVDGVVVRRRPGARRVAGRQEKREAN